MKKNDRGWKVTVCLVGILFVALVAGVAGFRAFSGEAKTPDISSQASVSQDLPEDESQVSSAPQNVSTVFRRFAPMTVPELIKESSLVVVGTYKEPSQSFMIQYVNGGMSIYTDHYFEVTETFRGEAPEDNIVAVRQEGGTIGNDAVEIEPSCDFQEGESYLLFLYRPGKGGFSTEGDYYCLRGEVYGAYPLDGTTLAEVSTDQVVNEVENNAIQVADFQQQVDYYNETTPPDEAEKLVREQVLENMKENVRTGMMTQEEYDEAVADMEKYATYVGDPPAGYSGDE